ncbi:MAG: prepilin peptidase [Rhizobiales bacterium]|nr:prepilin peptidase [Hyphomicrobiales bacterium]
MTSEILTFLFAAPFVGSLPGVVVDRLHHGEAFLVGRSRCDRCTQILRPDGLLPLITFAGRLGRRGCGESRLRLFHPLIELSALAVALSAALVTSGWLLLAAVGRTIDRHSPIAFGPCLALAFWLVWLAGPIAPS